MGRNKELRNEKYVSNDARASVYDVKITKPNNNISHNLKEIKILPNYSFKNREISLASQLPKKFSEGIWTIKPETGFRKNMIANKNKIEQKLSSCGKLFCVRIDKHNLYKNSLRSILRGSFSIVRLNDQTVKAVSALQVVKSDSNKLFEEIIFGSFDEKITIKDWEIRRCCYLGSIQDKISNFRKFLKEKIFYEFKITPGYLKSRRDYLIHVKKEKKEKILLDPEYNLQPQPSVDLVFLDLPENLLYKISKEQLKPLKISERINPKLGYLVAFHDRLWKKTEKNSTKYCKTEVLESIELEKLLHENKSIGQCVITTYSTNIINYLATAGEGSSGGCILDEDGDIIGINFGGYSDEKQQGKVSKKIDSYDFISKEENRNNYLLSKNTNLALNLKHDFLDFYFKQNPVKVENAKGSFLNKKRQRANI